MEKRKSQKKLYGILFAVTFFIFRILIGTIKSISLWKILLKNLYADWRNSMTLVLSSSFLLLNYFCMFKIIKKLKTEN